MCLTFKPRRLRADKPGQITYMNKSVRNSCLFRVIGNWFAYFFSEGGITAAARVPEEIQGFVWTGLLLDTARLIQTTTKQLLVAWHQTVANARAHMMMWLCCQSPH